MNQRENISDFIKSLLISEIVNRCPMCGVFEGTRETFTNHHIDHNSSNSYYWNLIRICKVCHKDINTNKGDGKRDRKLKLIKRDLFRRYVGPASLEVLLLAYKHDVTSSLPCLANPLIRLNLIRIELENTFTTGTAKHFTLSDYKITKEGKELVDKLRLQ